MKKHSVFIIIAFLAGILLLLQIRSFKKIDALVKRSKPADIFAELRILQAANTDLKSNIEEEEKIISELQSKIAREAIEDEIKKLRLLSGEDAISGEGIEIEFSEAVEDFWITDLIAQLVGAGAEAIAVNDIRLTEKTAGFRSVAGGFLMRSSFLRPPLRIMAIGPKQELNQSIAQSGGILGRIEETHKNLRVSLLQKDKIIISGLNTKKPAGEL